MHVHTAEFMLSAVRPEQYPGDDVPEVALAGRSNVGKSSFINRLIQRKDLARTSSRPGRTQTLNFYNINDAFRIVDVPGYGYARVSKQDREAWAEMINTYLEPRENLEILFLLMDARHEPTELDQQMKDFAEAVGLPYAIVMTKIDKVKRNQRNQQMNVYKQALGLPTTDALFPFSAETGEGADEIWEIIDAYLELEAEDK